MGYLALYRKYRPTSFENVVGQTETIKVIKNSIENNKVSHAYLFSGPRGTGKTTTAKIIAKMVNCESLKDGKLCGKCPSCLNRDNNDIIEIDAASNNGVDEIRAIRDSVNLVPSNCKYKIYIIDEVHMLTPQAFNALLKTLEEPPSHIIFILATTEYYKIPLTIISRCQKFQFNKLTLEEIVKNLDKISKSEKVNITNESLYEIAKIADGAMRDAINLLDQLISSKSDDIILEDVYNICDIVSTKEIIKFIQMIKNKDSENIINIIESINSKGYDINHFLEEVIFFIKDVIVYKYNQNKENIINNISNVKLIEEMFNVLELNNLIIELNDIFNKIKNTNYPSIIMTVEVLKIINRENESLEQVLLQQKDQEISNNEKSEKLSNKEEKHICNKDSLSNDQKHIRINNSFATANKQNLIEIKSKWKQILDYVLDEKFCSVAGILNDSLPVVVGANYMIISSNFDSVVDRINEQYEDIENLLFKIFGTKYVVVGLTSTEWKKIKSEYVENIKNGNDYILIESKLKDKKESNDIDALINIVGEEIIEYK